MAGQALEAEALAEQPGCRVARDQRRLDQDRARAAEGVQERRAPVPAGQQDDGRGQGYIEENDLYFFTLRGKDRSLAWGTLEECLDIIAATVDSAEDWL